ncbi:MAG: hypothetical protein OXE87_14305, partial [Chloroflexi bacterium]|nr:hypothetical protein [Chloroflexota bacterium]
ASQVGAAGGAEPGTVGVCLVAEHEADGTSLPVVRGLEVQAATATGRRSQTSQGRLQALSDESIGGVAGILVALQIPEGRGAVQQGQHRPIVGQAFNSVGEAFHLPHRGQRTEQRPRDQGPTARTVGRPEVQVVVLHSRDGLAEQPATEVPAVGDDAAALIDKVTAQGQVAVHVDVGAVHGQRDSMLGELRRRAAAQQAPGTGAGGDVGTTAHRGGAEGGLIRGHFESAFDGIVQACLRVCASDNMPYRVDSSW